MYFFVQSQKFIVKTKAYKHDSQVWNSHTIFFLIPSQFVQKMYVNETGLLAIFGILTKYYTCFATKNLQCSVKNPVA